MENNYFNAKLSSQVFNKCYNYEIFEPLRISDLCNRHLESLLGSFSIDDEFPAEVRCWLAERLSSIDGPNFKSPRDLVTQYRKTVPVVVAKLDEIIDPTHNDKLLQALAYDRLASIVVNGARS